MEQKKAVVIVVTVVLLWGLAPVAWAQRGMGDTSGVVRQGLRLETVVLQGQVLRVITGPCEKATGRSDIGTHFILKTEQGREQNIHLGPAHLVRGVTDLLSDGATVSVRVFRTEKMPQGHYNAVTVRLGDKMMRLRDQYLRPVWAGRAPSMSYRSDVNYLNTDRQCSVYLPRQLGPYQSPQPRLRRGYSSGRMGQGRGRGQGRGWCCQGGQSRFGRQRRAWR
jgi:hypothetical protein